MSRLGLTLFLSGLLLASVPAIADAVTIYVDDKVVAGTPCGNDTYCNGTSMTCWNGSSSPAIQACPKKTVKAAYGASDDGDTIVVAAGQYSEADGYLLIYKSLTLRSKDCDPTTTILNLEIIFNVSGMIEGFTINSPFQTQNGIHVSGPAVGIVGNIIEGNDFGVVIDPTATASLLGNIVRNNRNTGIYGTVNGTPTNSGCSVEIDGRVVLPQVIPVISNNGLVLGENRPGGGIRLESCDSTITNYVIEGNHGDYGGGLQINGGAATVASCEISGNHALHSGGGAHLFWPDSVSIVNTTFSGNEAPWSGGGLELVGLPASVAAGESACDQGVITHYTYLQNALFTCNQAQTGAGIFTAGSNILEVVNTTFVHNKIVSAQPPAGNPPEGGAIFVHSGCTKLWNSIIWDNDVTGLGNPQIKRFGGAEVKAGWSIAEGGVDCYQGPCDGPINSSNPLFEDPFGVNPQICTGDESFRLSSSSPGIDAGNNQKLLPDFADINRDHDFGQATPWDLDENARITGPAVDLGPYERGSAFFQAAECNPAPSGDDINPDPKCRFISFKVPCATNHAIKITIKDLHHPVPPYTGAATTRFSQFNGRELWVGPPSPYLESPSSGITLWASRLQFTPHYQDWSSVHSGSCSVPGQPCSTDSDCPPELGGTCIISTVLHVTGPAVAPSSQYEVVVVPAFCQGHEDECCLTSDPLTVNTSRWGDVETPRNPPSTTAQPDVADISALVSKFRSALGAPIKARALLVGSDAFGNIDLVPPLHFGHIAAAVDAFRGKAYPFKPGRCRGNPSQACITNTICTSGTGPCDLVAD